MALSLRGLATCGCARCGTWYGTEEFRFSLHSVCRAVRLVERVSLQSRQQAGGGRCLKCVLLDARRTPQQTHASGLYCSSFAAASCPPGPAPVAAAVLCPAQVTVLNADNGVRFRRVDRSLITGKPQSPMRSVAMVGLHS